MTLTSVTCLCNLSYVNQPQERCWIFRPIFFLLICRPFFLFFSPHSLWCLHCGLPQNCNSVCMHVCVYVWKCMCAYVSPSLFLLLLLVLFSWALMAVKPSSKINNNITGFSLCPTNVFPQGTLVFPFIPWMFETGSQFFLFQGQNPTPNWPLF